MMLGGGRYKTLSFALFLGKSLFQKSVDSIYSTLDFLCIPGSKATFYLSFQGQ